MGRTRERALVALVAVALGFAACAGGGGSGDRDDGNGNQTDDAKQTSLPGAPSPRVSGRFEFTGPITDSGTYDVAYVFAGTKVRTCASLAGADAGSYAIPVPTLEDEHRFNWVASIPAYEGPDEYHLKDLEQITIDVRRDAQDEPKSYRSDEGSTATVTIEKDNSGKMTFDGLSGPADAKLGGSLSWTCTDPDEAE